VHAYNLLLLLFTELKISFQNYYGNEFFFFALEDLVLPLNCVSVRQYPFHNVRCVCMIPRKDQKYNTDCEHILCVTY